MFNSIIFDSNLDYVQQGELGRFIVLKHSWNIITPRGYISTVYKGQDKLLG